MIIRGGDVCLQDNSFKRCDIRIADGKIVELAPSLEAMPGEEVVNAEGLDVLPGLVDIHSHGRVGEDFSNADIAGIEKMCRSYAECGITTVLATTMTNEPELYKNAMRTIGQYRKEEHPGAKVAGINMEGPFLGKDKKGAHDEQYLFPLSKELFDEWDALSDYSVRLLDLDPCLEGSLDFIRAYAGKKRISLAHTSCDYDLAAKAFLAGADHVTHLFNAMNTLYHRQPGLIGAVADYPAYAEIICDGIHIHPSVIRLMFAACGEKMVLISDSMQAAGLPDGNYELGGLAVTVTNKKATLADGTIAGSTTDMFEAMTNVIRFGVAKEKAVASATVIPAKSVGIEDEAGVIAIGRAADLLLMTKDLQRVQVFLNGEAVK